jgi:hypothetical protein
MLDFERCLRTEWNRGALKVGQDRRGVPNAACGRSGIVMHLKLVRTLEEELAHLNAIDTGLNHVCRLALGRDGSMPAPLRTLRRVLKRKS